MTSILTRQTNQRLQRNARLFACHQCLKLRPSRHFSDKQMKRTRTKGRAGSGRRFCLDCGMNRNIYHPGNMVQLNGLSRYLCARCLRFRGNSFCLRCLRCGECLGVQDFLSDEQRRLGDKKSETNGGKNGLHCPQCSSSMVASLIRVDPEAHDMEIRRFGEHGARALALERA
jgi:hypothetical protein